MEQALFFGAIEKLLSSSELTSTDRLALMIYMFVVFAIVMTLWSYFLSPRRQKILLQDQRRMESLSRPWTLLALFYGDLYAASLRPAPSKEGKLLALHKLGQAASPDMFTNTASVSSLAYVSELLVQRIPTILIPALVAGARAASKLRRFHSILAVAITCKSRQLCAELVNLGILDELAGCIDVRKSATYCAVLSSPS
ncbi:hypothetical protein GUITHDRAFT_113786 [Guillardia theta CCMP2712]|uniref:Uncharacterized protein n=1 Tax=Guillardia theta (strain CCMP2712) TaxID=905079 RepID=L1IUY3_GUITC|nr:hypothetical protein GUITHDRAFT_113786 [Guillardia theta CCMP2712]EKX40048.1 hypothetical protein GUITHDRAFT_113786 [Guillardia theta CCMP2712]|eukprot:XP_005827028.1 hypothetical protein GUITHDRAFT_113786 [Guillardia theta CCMP2712]